MLTHATLAKQNAPKLSDYTLTLIIELVIPILLLGVCPLEMGPRLISRRLPTWGVSYHLTTVGVPIQLQADVLTPHVNKNIQQIIAFYYVNWGFVPFV